MRPSEALVDLPESLVTHLDFTNDIEIRAVGLEHEKIPHLNCWLEHDAGDVEIVSNHHQIRGAVVFSNFLQNAFVVQFGLTVRYYTRWHEILNRSRATKRKLASVNATAIGGWSKPPQPQHRERGRLLQYAWPAPPR
jgi:hypothetical protein